MNNKVFLILMLNPAKFVTSLPLPLFVRSMFFVCCGVFVIAASGCAAKRDGSVTPKLVMPVEYKHAESAVKNSNEAAVEKAVQGEYDLTEWWRTFGSAELVALVDRGLANNADLRIATIRIAEAKSRADQIRAGTMPNISAPMGVTTQATGSAVGSVPVGSSGSVATGTNGGTVRQSYQSTLRATWRADIWGEQNSMVESAKFQLWLAAFERDNTQRNVVANIVASYLDFLALNDRLRVARNTELVLGGMLTAVETRLDAADATTIEMDQHKMAVYAARSMISTLEQQREEALTNMAFLVGTFPGALKLSEAGLEDIHLPVTVPALPSSLLLSRPDVRMAESRLLAADADVDVARARILPPLDLSAQVGYSSLAMASLFQPSTLFWNVLANVTANIFDGGKLQSAKEGAQALHEEMVENYARTIFQAVKEVESALLAIRQTGQRLDTQKNMTVSAQRLWDNGAESYAIGSIDYMAMLDTKRTFYRYQDEYIQIKASHYREYVSLFYALGGGSNVAGGGREKEIYPVALARKNSGYAATEPSDAVDWSVPLSSEKFWQVELPGLYPRSAVNAVGRDLKARYSTLMQDHFLRPKLHGKIEESVDSNASWYRLYVGKFTSPQMAQALCAELQSGFQRCRVIASDSDETVVVVKQNQDKG